MLKHIVFWNLRRDLTEAQRQEAKNTIKQGLEALVGVIDGLLKLEVLININPKGYDLGLYSEFRDEAAQEYYQQHPAHLKMRAYIHQHIEDRADLDAISD